MKTTKLLIFLMSILFLPIQLRAETQVIENFSGREIGKFPTDFKTYPFQRGKALKIYSVQSEGNNFVLHGEDHGEHGTPVFKRFEWDVQKWPVLSWRWKAVTLPQNGKTNDCACGVYIVFGGWGGKSIKYSWSTTLPVGGPLENQEGKFYTFIKDSGSKNVGQWQTMKINILEDYRKVFNEEPKHSPSGFAVLTDGDDTQSPSACDYDDFSISTTE